MNTKSRATERLHMAVLRANLVFASVTPGAAPSARLDRQAIVRRGLLGFREAAQPQSFAVK